MAYWLIKSPYRTRTWAKVLARGEFQLYGIRNAQARNNIAQMLLGDEAVFYFERTVWGIMRVETVPSPDPTNGGSKWLTVSFLATRTLESPVLLESLKSTAVFLNSPLLRQPRLSVVPLSLKQWQCITVNG